MIEREEAKPSEGESKLVSDDGDVRCPVCGSTDFWYRGYMWCRNCNYFWYE